ncbi:MAG: molybdopterin molybdenumtransferase MoeA, partial [Micrococcales bacterium]|nr:molybdopterin molybdenumtransferase MoeA [Micrococcales bacterium]
AEVVVVEHLGDDRGAVGTALRREQIDLLVSTGGTGHGYGDHLVGALEALGAMVPVRGIGMRPGHPTILAARPDGVPLLGLPGNPFAALAALVALGLPLLAGLVRASAPPVLPRTAAVPMAGTSSGVRLVAVAETPDGLVPVTRQGAAMTCGLAQADALALVEGAGVAAGGPVGVLALPWTR